MVCSFVPRKFDYHPLAIPAPYNHSNINSDEVIYYVAGNFMSRRGVGISSFTLHPAGIPHGPHPGTVGGVDRQGGDRGAGGHGRHVPPAPAHPPGRGASRTPAIRIRGCRPRTPPARPASSASAGRRRSRTDAGNGHHVRHDRSARPRARPRRRHRPARPPSSTTARRCFGRSSRARLSRNRTELDGPRRLRAWVIIDLEHGAGTESELLGQPPTPSVPRRPLRSSGRNPASASGFGPRPRPGRARAS